MEIVRVDGTVVMTVAQPWARDANGKDLPTSYTLDGTTLTQTVDTATAAFPVVADPRVERTGFLGLTGLKVWFTRRETEDLYRQRNAIIFGTTTLSAAVCFFVPGPLSLVCGAVLNSTTVDFANNVDEAHRRNNCLTLAIKTTGPGLPDWDDGDGDGDGQYCEHP